MITNLKAEKRHVDKIKVGGGYTRYVASQNIFRDE